MKSEVEGAKLSLTSVRDIHVELGLSNKVSKDLISTLSKFRYFNIILLNSCKSNQLYALKV